MWNCSKYNRGLLILGIYFLLEFQGTHPLSCHHCRESKDPDRCQTKSGEALVCSANVKTCLVSTGFRVNDGKSYPVMTRRCTVPMDAATDSKIFSAAVANGHKMVCRLVVRSGSFNLPPDFVDRRCICAEDNCNGKLWNDVMSLPYLPANFSEGDKPVVPTSPGKESLENVNKVLGLTPGEKPSLINDTTDDPSNTDDTSNQSTAVTGSGPSSATTSATAATGNPAVAAKSSTAAEGGGSKAGLIAGAAVGGVSLLGLLSGLLYWLFVLRKRKKKRKSSDGSGASANSADTDASGENND